MIVFDLICKNASHQFEGWFGSSDDFEQQKSSGLLICPMCGSADINKALMAPNVGAKGNQVSESKTVEKAPAFAQTNDTSNERAENSAVQVPAEYKEILEKLAKAQTRVLEKSEWVGDDLPEKAREMHYGDSEEKPIHGIATPEDVADMEDEGIELAVLPFPVAPPESQN
ncbi:MAG: DUF1178 family protein [Parasphingorhabdus sp.]